jgi:acylphosphatase
LEAAATFGVTGWVRNRLDSSVELLMQGPADALDRMQRWLADGVAAARVDAIEVMADDSPAGRFTRFEARPTA